MNTYLKASIMLLLVVFNLRSTQAQNGYDAAMQSTLQSFSQAKEVNDFIELANRFEQIGHTASDQWIPMYYAAYCQLITGIYQQKSQDKDRYFDQAIQTIQIAHQRSLENSEIYALKGYALLMKMGVDPQKRFKLISQAEVELEKSIQLDPTNPRPHFIKGQNTFYTPKFFGGGAKAAKPLLETAQKLFDAFKPTVTYGPDWGKDRCEMLLQQIKAD